MYLEGVPSRYPISLNSVKSKLDLGFSCAKDFRSLSSMVTWCVG